MSSDILSKTLQGRAFKMMLASLIRCPIEYDKSTGVETNTSTGLSPEENVIWYWFSHDNKSSSNNCYEELSPFSSGDADEYSVNEQFCRILQ